jgi:hypothetical protein
MSKQPQVARVRPEIRDLAQRTPLGCLTRGMTSRLGEASLKQRAQVAQTSKRLAESSHDAFLCALHHHVAALQYGVARFENKNASPNWSGDRRSSHPLELCVGRTSLFRLRSDGIFERGDRFRLVDAGTVHLGVTTF